MNWLNVIGPTFLVIVGGFTTWLIQNRIQKLNSLQDELRSKRIDVYRKVIDPIVVMYSKGKGGGTSKAEQNLQSYEYRKTVFDLNYWGSDEVIHAINNLMQFIYTREKNGKDENDSTLLLTLLGNLLLEIRRDLGNSRTSFNARDMFRAMITDIDDVMEKR